MHIQFSMHFTLTNFIYFYSNIGSENDTPHDVFSLPDPMFLNIASSLGGKIAGLV